MSYQRNGRKDRLDFESAKVIRPVQESDAAEWATMRSALWPDADSGELLEEATSFVRGLSVATVSTVFIADVDGPAGFIELSLRPYANGCDSRPVPFVEGWYVTPKVRGHGFGRALVLAAEDWARERGFTEIGSDAEIANDGSLAAHERCGFVETKRVVFFRKPLAPAPETPARRVG
jgi:aminoglycoside 6'-N-acetyltransferase I